MSLNAITSLPLNFLLFPFFFFSISFLLDCVLPHGDPFINLLLFLFRFNKFRKIFPISFNPLLIWSSAVIVYSLVQEGPRQILSQLAHGWPSPSSLIFRILALPQILTIYWLTYDLLISLMQLRTSLVSYHTGFSILCENCNLTNRCPCSWFWRCLPCWSPTSKYLAKHLFHIQTTAENFRIYSKQHLHDFIFSLYHHEGNRFCGTK